jgi:CBS domain-containing protein
MHDLTVADAMHVGIHAADPGASIETLAATMAEQSIHCVVVEGVRASKGERLVWGIVTDRDLLSAIHADSDADAGQLAASEPMAVGRRLPLPEAITLMVEHDLTHLVVVDELDGRPTGILSTLDVARVWAERPRLEA